MGSRIILHDYSHHLLSLDYIKSSRVSFNSRNKNSTAHTKSEVGKMKMKGVKKNM